MQLLFTGAAKVGHSVTQHKIVAFAKHEVSRDSFSNRATLPRIASPRCPAPVFSGEYHYHRRVFGLRLSPALAPEGGHRAQRAGFTVPSAVYDRSSGICQSAGKGRRARPQ